MKRVSEGQEPTVAVPPVLADVEVQVPLVAVPVEIRNVAVAIRVLPNGALIMYKAPSMPLPIESR